MKVYDTDEDAIALGERKKMLAKAITFAIMALFSALGIWLTYTVFFAPKTTALAAPIPVALSGYLDQMPPYPGQASTLLQLDGPEPQPRLCWL